MRPYRDASLTLSIKGFTMKKITLALVAFGMLAVAAPADLDAGPPRVEVTCALDGGATVPLPGRASDLGYLIDICRNQFGGRVAGVQIL